MEDSNSTGVEVKVADNMNNKQALGVFNQNEYFAYIYKKTEKLVTAVYMITNFIKDNEPLKWRIREKALSLMSLNLSFGTVSLSERKDLLKKYGTYSTEIVSLSAIGHHSGLISEMNYHILKREFELLVGSIEADENKKSTEETVALTPSFFDIGGKEKPSPAVKSALAEYTLDKAPLLAESVRKPEQVYKGQSVEPKRQIDLSSREIPREKPSTSPVAEKKNSRQEAILGMLRKKQGLNIKDFTTVISGCSEKTIQRELIDMVAQGTVRKEGERRWSRYFLPA